MEGYIKFHRSILNWEWWHDINVFRLFTYLLLKANHKAKSWRGINIKRGQLITSLPSLEKQTGLSVQQIRTALMKLKSTGELTEQSTNKYRLITLVNYCEYQGTDKDSNRQKNIQDNRQSTGNQQASNRLATANKNDKNIKNERIKTNTAFAKPTIQEIKDYCEERKNNIDAETFFNHYETANWFRGKTKIKKWKACVRTWENKDKKESTEIKPMGMDDVTNREEYEAYRERNWQEFVKARKLKGETDFNEQRKKNHFVTLDKAMSAKIARDKKLGVSRENKT